MIRRKFKRAVTDSENEVRYDPVREARRQQPARHPRRGHRPGAGRPRQGLHAVRAVEVRRRRRRGRAADADPGPLPRAARRPRRAHRRCCAPARRRPARSRRRRCSGPTTPSASCPPDARPALNATDRRILAAGAAGPRQPRGRAALHPRRHRHRRPPRHGPARRARAGGDGPRPRRRGVQLPDLRHDGARRPPHRRRPTPTTRPRSPCRRCGCRRSSASPSPR